MALLFTTPSLLCILGVLPLIGADLIRVALYTGHGTTQRARHNTGAVLNYHGSGIVATTVNESDIPFLSRDSFDVVYFPGGGGTTQAKAIGTAGQEAVKHFVQNGGGYVGVCAGAFLASQHLRISAFKDTTRPVKGKSRGDGNCTLALTTEGVKDLSPFAVDPSAMNKTEFFYANGPVMGLSPKLPNVSNPRPLVVFTSSSVPIEKKYTGPNAGQGKVAVGVNNFGEGLVLVSGPHPETNEMNFPKEHGPPSALGKVRADLLQSYVKRVVASRAGEDVSTVHQLVI